MIVDPCWKVGNIGADEVFVIGLPGLPDGMCGRLLRLRKTILRMCIDTLNALTARSRRGLGSVWSPGGGLLWWGLHLPFVWILLTVSSLLSLAGKPCQAI